MEHIKKPIDIKSWKLAEVDLSEPMYSEMYEPINLNQCTCEIEGEIIPSEGYSNLMELIKQQKLEAENFALEVENRYLKEKVIQYSNKIFDLEKKLFEMRNKNDR